MIRYNIHSLHCPAAVGILQPYKIAGLPQSIPHERNESLPGRSTAKTYINIQNIFIILNKLSKKAHLAAKYLHVVIYEIRVSHNSVNEDQRVLGYDVTLNGKY